MRKKILSIWLSVCMVLTMLPISAMAEEADTPIGSRVEIIAFAPLVETEKLVPTGTSIEDLGLPETLTATVRTAMAADSGTAEESVQDSGNQDNLTEATPGSATPTGSGEQTEADEVTDPEWNITTSDIPITWTSEPKYDMDAEGVYVFKPVIEGYTVSANLPEITVTVGTKPRMMLMRGGAPTTYGDFSVSIDENGATPTFDDSSNTLTFSAAGEYTVGMAGEKASTSNRIVVNATGEVKLNLDGVTIEAQNGSSAVPDGATALTVTNGSVTLNVIADSSLTGGMGNPGFVEVGKSGVGISGNITVMGTATLAVTGGKGGSTEGGTGGAGGAGISGDVTVTGAATLTATGGAAGTGHTNNGVAGVGIRGNVNVSGTATLVAISGSGAAGMAIINAGRTGGGAITVGDGYTVVVGTDAEHTTVLTETSTTAQYVAITLPTPQAQWGVAGTENSAPNNWTGSGNLTDAMTYANGLSSGTAYIQLLTNIDNSATQEFASGRTTVLDLNGKTITAKARNDADRYHNVLFISGQLTLCDSSTDTVAEQGKITGGHGTGDGTGGGVYVDFSGTFIMTGGNITGNTAMNGGGVGSIGTFNMTGGSIAGNSCISGSGSVSGGGGVVNLGNFNMSGGSITGNTVAVGGAGGGVLTDSMKLSGNVNISGNTVGTASDNVALMGAGSGIPAIHITGTLTNSTAIGVSIVELSRDDVFTPKVGKFTFGEDVVNSDYISKFVSDNSGFAVIADGSQLKLAAAKAITKVAATNGSFTVEVNGNEVPSAIEGQTVTVTPTASSGYELDTVTVCKTETPNTAVTVTNGSFTMPAYAVTVNVTFKVSSTLTYTIIGTIKGSDTSAGIPANLQLKNSSGNVGSVVTAAANGSYSITSVLAGSYTIAVSCTGYDSCTITGITVSNTAIKGVNLTLTKSGTGLTDAQKLAAAQAAIMAAINRMSFSNSTTAADILSVAQAASLYGVTVAWDNTNEFTKTQATASAKGSIRGTLTLALNHESGGIGIDATIAKLSTGGDSGGGGSNGGGSTTPPSTKPTEPVIGSTENKATVDNKGNASVSLTDKNITDAIADAKVQAAKKGVNAGDITAVIHVTTGGKNADTVTVNMPKTTQEQVIDNKIASVQLVIDRPNLTIGINLAAVTEINRQAKVDVQLSATRMNNATLSGDAKAAIGNRPVYDLKATYGSGKSVTDFGKGRVSVEIPYTLQKGEIAGNVYAVYVDTKCKVTYLTDSSYDTQRGTVVFSTSHFSTYGVAYKASFQFSDIDGHWAKDDILFVANRGLMTGTSTITFSPNGLMTRGMFVTVLGRLANVDTSAYKQSVFTDVKADAYYMGYIEWGVKNNILVGIGGGKFDPDGLVTREQMAVIMDRYATAIGFKLPEVHIQNIFADNAKIGAWAAPSVKRIQMAGIIQGKSGNIYDPQGTATRAEVSAVLRRFVELAIFSDTAQG